MGFFTIGLFAVIGLTVLLNILISRGKSKQTDYGAITEEERLANQTRKREIGPEVFVKPDLDKLPFNIFNRNAGAAEAAESVKKAAGMPMVRFDTDLSNNDLKFMYGVANLEHITKMEENYRSFISAALAWAEILLAEGEDAGAEAILGETLRLKSDFSRCYTLLADIYERRGDAAALKALRTRAAEADYLPLGIKQKLPRK